MQPTTPPDATGVTFIPEWVAGELGVRIALTVRVAEGDDFVFRTLWRTVTVEGFEAMVAKCREDILLEPRVSPVAIERIRAAR